MSTPASIEGEAPTGPPTPVRTWAVRGVLFVVWCVAVGLLGLAALRIVWHDGVKPLTWLNAFTLYVYLPAYLVLAVAFCFRRWRLAALAAAVVACHLVWIAPDFNPASRLAAFTPGNEPPALRIFFANISMFNEDYSGLIAEIERVDPDVVAFAEFTPTFQRDLRQARFMRAYTYGNELFGPYMGEVVVFSRVPTERAITTWEAERPVILLDVPMGDQHFRLVTLHSPRPMRYPMQNYDGYWASVLPLLATQPRPLVVVGDFNATQHSWVYKQLLATGLRSAHVDRGRGYAVTWPNGEFPVPPIRIDQALLSPEVDCLKIEEGIGTGSDHRPLILEVRLRPTIEPRSGRTD